MTMFSLRLDDGLAARFDAAARVHGGRSARLRQLIEGDIGGLEAVVAPAPTVVNGARLMVRLRPAEAAYVARESMAMGLPRAAWVAALVARRAQAGLVFAAGSERALIAVQSEIHRIGVNVNQIARALNTAVMDGRVLELEMAALDDLRRELRGHLIAVREGVLGNQAYWDVAP